MSKLTLLDDGIAVTADDEQTMSPGGIAIPPTASKDEPSDGEVVYVGPGKRSEKGDIIPLRVKPGQKVLFNKYAGTKVELDGKTLRIMRESDILAIVED